MVRHVLAIYGTTRGGQTPARGTGDRAEHGAQLTVAVMGGYPSRAGGCQLRDARWDVTLREEPAAEVSHAREALGPAPAHLAVIEGRGTGAIASAAERMRCDLVVVQVGRLALRGGLARALGRRTTSTVIGVRGTRQ